MLAIFNFGNFVKQIRKPTHLKIDGLKMIIINFIVKKANIIDLLYSTNSY